jgi:hypothetical protein
MPINSQFPLRPNTIRVRPGDVHDRRATDNSDVLTGKVSVKDALQREADRSGLWKNMRTPCSPDHYDPVLRHHLRISED